MSTVTRLGCWGQLALLLGGCSTGHAPPPTVAAVTPTRSHLESAFSPEHQARVPRTVLHCPAGPCIILHYPPSEVDVETAEVLAGDPATQSDDGWIFSQAGNRWCDPKLLSCFNCNTFAVGDFLGLTPRDWLWGDPSELTNHVSPIQVVLESYFRHIRTYDPYSLSSGRHFAEDRGLRPGDVVCFVGVDPSGKVRDYAHAAKVWKHRDRNWLIGKLGAGPIVITPLGSQGRYYRGLFNQVRVYRFVGPQAKPPVPASGASAKS